MMNGIMTLFCFCLAFGGPLVPMTMDQNASTMKVELVEEKIDDDVPSPPPPQEPCKCASSWTMFVGGDCVNTQYGCPSSPCDGDYRGSWCVIEESGCQTEESSGGWAFCTPEEAWVVVTPGTKLEGKAINEGTPLPVTLTLNLGDNVWIVGLVDLDYLKMVKIKITGSTTYEWQATRYYNPATGNAACKEQATFTEACFAATGTISQPDDVYPVALHAITGCRVGEKEVTNGECCPTERILEETTTSCGSAEEDQQDPWNIINAFLTDDATKGDRRLLEGDDDNDFDTDVCCGEACEDKIEAALIDVYDRAECVDMCETYGGVGYCGADDGDEDDDVPSPPPPQGCGADEQKVTNGDCCGNDRILEETTTTCGPDGQDDYGDMSIYELVEEKTKGADCIPKDNFCRTAELACCSGMTCIPWAPKGRPPSPFVGKCTED